MGDVRAHGLGHEDQFIEGSPPGKRRRLNNDGVELSLGTGTPWTETSNTKPSIQARLERPISPPPSKFRRLRTSIVEAAEAELRIQNLDQGGQSEPVSSKVKDASHRDEKHDLNDGGYRGNRIAGTNGDTFLSSPFQLTKIRDLGPQQNIDTVTLRDILGDPMIKECWNFNFLFDLEFVLEKFDPDIRSTVNLRIVHGFWRKDDHRREALLAAAERHPNIQLTSAYIPDPFGTHHSKMLILVRHDDLAQIIIHTANMIPRDWANMTQAVWRSPLLPLKSKGTDLKPSDASAESQTYSIGSGERFKIDLLRYLNAYGKRLTELTNKLVKFDFEAIQAAFIGSAPSRQKPRDLKPEQRTGWGWLGLREILSSIPVQDNQETKHCPHIVAQISSIATLGPTSAWLLNFQSVLASQGPGRAILSKPARSAMGANIFRKSVSKALTPKFSVIFPTAEEIRTSLDGYASGGSIHTKLQSATQQKQLGYLRPFLCHWKHLREDEDREGEIPKAERGFAAPHIKTYVRFSDETQSSIDWAMVTSANLSKQAWGELENKNQEIWIQSWECGVVVWPTLFSQSKMSDASNFDVEMVPVFGKDMPDEKNGQKILRVKGEEGNKTKIKEMTTIVGFRMPYDVPLEPYGMNEIPWCATMTHDEPDWMGNKWNG